LEGGQSGEVTAIEVELSEGHRHQFVIREYRVSLGHRDHSAPDRDFRLLEILRTEGIPAPRPVRLGRDGGVGAHPFVVVDFIEGSPPAGDLAASEMSRQLAGVLERIHRVDEAGLGLAFLPDLQERIAASLAGPLPAGGSLNEEAIRTVIGHWRGRPANPKVLLHGDFWPGNTIWLDGRLVGVIDWEDAAVGDPFADVGNARLEILWASGVEAMTSFTEHYREAAHPLDWSSLPLWDLWAGWRGANLGSWGMDPGTMQKWRALHSWFIGEALAALGR
jgi:aminoglycoside phosphotransferase (APT) family kinase protein